MYLYIGWMSQNSHDVTSEELRSVTKQSLETWSLVAHSKIAAPSEGDSRVTAGLQAHNDDLA